MTSVVVRLRPVRDEDAAFLESVYRARRDDLLAMGLPEAQLATLVGMQHRALESQIRHAHPNAEHRIVEADGVPVGRIVWAITGEGLHGVDVAMLPASRSRGIGSELIGQLRQEAASLGIPMRFRVERANDKAIRLYQRLGFRVLADEAPHLLMQWDPP